MTLCREYSLVKHRIDTVEIHPLKCRCWHCEYCAPMRAAQLKKLAFLGEPNTFITLTVNPAKFNSPDERARALSRAFRLLWKRVKRKYHYDRMPFLAVFEKTKLGEPHLHVLARVEWIDQAWMSQVMDELIGAPIVDIRRCHDKKRVAGYVTKYIGKDPARFQGCKRYWRSQDWVSKEQWDGEDDERLKEPFRISTYDVDHCVHRLLKGGWRIVHREADHVTMEVMSPGTGPPPEDLLRLTGIVRE